jgi:23S rRNA pseudouridine955/2504/2580 synthase
LAAARKSAANAGQTRPPPPPEASFAVERVCVDEAGEGQRLDNFLIRHWKGVPKTHVYRVIRSGEVRVNKGRAAADTRLAIGDELRLPPVRTAPEPAARSTAPAREFPIVWEDEVLIALDKPAGVAVHGGSGVSFGVIEQLRRARPQANKVIDLALHKTLDAAGERHVRVVDADHADGRRSISLVKLVKVWPAFSLLDVTIKTGRTHQIRVHLAHEGHPIVGDPKYGDFELNRALARGTCVAGRRFERMFLHARRLSFEHPTRGEVIELVAPLPAECEAFLAALDADAASIPGVPAARAFSP